MSNSRKRVYTFSQSHLFATYLACLTWRTQGLAISDDVVQCWPGRSAASDWVPSFSACCVPGSDARCWHRWDTLNGQRVELSWARCCAHTAKDTLEGVVRSAALETLPAPLVCPAKLRWACALARNRTLRARTTRETAKYHLTRATDATDSADKLTIKGKAPPIPVLGWPVAFDATKLSLRLLRSIDHPVERLILVATGNSQHLPDLIDHAKLVRPDIEIVRVSANLGCAGGWNEVIHAVPEASWWLLASHDIAFPPGTLERIASVTEAALARESRGWRPAPGLRSFAIRGQPSYANTLPSFVLTRRAVAQAGLFDENFWPAYAEDLDYLNRLKLVGGSGVGAAAVRDSTIEIVHGPEDWEDGIHYSGVEQFAWGSSGKADELQEDADEESRRFEVKQMLESADNYHLHFCQKFGPLGRGNCSDMAQYAALGPFGLHNSGWDDWILDPARRICTQRLSSLCGFDMRLLSSNPPHFK